MNAITPYLFENESLVRVSDHDGEPWFVAKDVCAALGIVWKVSDSTGPLAEMDEDERGSLLVDTLGGNQEVVVISESGLYARTDRASEVSFPGGVK